jgi:hypothetical protein
MAWLALHFAAFLCTFYMAYLYTIHNFLDLAAVIREKSWGGSETVSKSYLHDSYFSSSSVYRLFTWIPHVGFNCFYIFVCNLSAGVL